MPLTASAAFDVVAAGRLTLRAARPPLQSCLMQRLDGATPSSTDSDGSDERKAEEPDHVVVITEEFIAPDSTPRLSDSPSSSPSTPHLRLNESISSLDDDGFPPGQGASFSSLSSSIASLHTAIARLSRRLDEPQAVYLVDSSASSRPLYHHQQQQRRPRSSPPIGTPSPRSLAPSSPSPHAPASGRRRSCSPSSRARRPLSPAVRSVIERQQRMMAEVMQLLSMPPHWHIPPSASSSLASASTHAEHVDARKQPERRPQPPFLHLADPQYRSASPPTSSPSRSPQRPPVEVPTQTRRLTGRHPSLPDPARATHAVAAPSTRSRPPAASPPRRPRSLSPEARSACPSPPPQVRPPLPPSLQAQLNALRYKEEVWKSRLRSNRTQRMREERVRTKTREEEEERKRREEEEKGEQSRKELIDRAMRERWAAPLHRQQQSQAAQPNTSRRLEWVRRRDAGHLGRVAESASHPAARGSVSLGGREKRPAQRSEVLVQEENVRGQGSEGRRGSSAVLFTSAELRSLGFVDVEDDDDEEEGGEGEEGDEKRLEDAATAAGSLHRALARLGLHA